MNILIRLYRIYLRESDKERRDYLNSLAQAGNDDERLRAQAALDDHDARLRGVQAALESQAEQL